MNLSLCNASQVPSSLGVSYHNNLMSLLYLHCYWSVKQRACLTSRILIQLPPHASITPSRHKHCRSLISRTPASLLFQLSQEGQHPLTGQRAANFRLLANQWAERRLVTQWRHGCCAMRRSVCNAGASNGGRSICVQISKDRSYPMPIYWYRSKGNWLRYNYASDNFCVMKLCSRLFVLYCRNRPNDDKFK